MTQPSAPLRMFLVVYNNEDGDNLDMFVMARVPVEAFEFWRIHYGMVPEEYANEDRQATVWHVPPTNGSYAPGVVPWETATSQFFALDDNTIEMQAVRAVWEAEHADDGHTSGIGQKD